MSTPVKTTPMTLPEMQAAGMSQDQILAAVLAQRDKALAIAEEALAQRDKAQSAAKTTPGTTKPPITLEAARHVAVSFKPIGTIKPSGKPEGKPVTDKWGKVTVHSWECGVCGKTYGALRNAIRQHAYLNLAVELDARRRYLPATPAHVVGKAEIKKAALFASGGQECPALRQAVTPTTPAESSTPVKGKGKGAGKGKAAK